MRHSQIRCCESSSLKTPVYVGRRLQFTISHVSHKFHFAEDSSLRSICHGFQPILKAFWPNEPSDSLTKAPPTCVLQAWRGVGRWREAVGSGLEGRRRLVADALGPLPALDSQAAPAGLVAVHPAGCHRSVHLEGGGGRRQGEVTGEEGRTAGPEER